MRIDTIASVSACPAQKCLRLALAAGRIDDIEGLIGDTIPNRVEVLDLAAYCPVTLHAGMVAVLNCALTDRNDGCATHPACAWPVGARARNRGCIAGPLGSQGIAVVERRL